MMGKTHLVMGIATSLVILQPTTPLGLITAVASGGLGGVIPDIDTVRNDYKADALKGQLFAFAILLIGISANTLKNAEIIRYILEKKTLSIPGIAIFLVLYFLGYFSKHRTFTHSLLAMLLFSLAVWLTSPEMAAGFLFGYCSHIMLDILNKKPLSILYPFGNGFCLKLCCASKLANTFFLWIGFAISLTMCGISICHMGL